MFPKDIMRHTAKECDNYYVFTCSCYQKIYPSLKVRIGDVRFALFNRYSWTFIKMRIQCLLIQFNYDNILKIECNLTCHIVMLNNLPLKFLETITRTSIGIWYGILQIIICPMILLFLMLMTQFLKNSLILTAIYKLETKWD